MTSCLNSDFSCILMPSFVSMEGNSGGKKLHQVCQPFALHTVAYNTPFIPVYLFVNMPANKQIFPNTNQLPFPHHTLSICVYFCWCRWEHQPPVLPHTPGKKTQKNLMMILLKKELKAWRKAKKTQTDTTVHDCALKNDTNSPFITNLFPKMLLFLWCTHPSPSPVPPLNTM